MTRLRVNQILRDCRESQVSGLDNKGSFGDCIPLSFATDFLVDGVLVHTLQGTVNNLPTRQPIATHLPWEFLVWQMPLQHLPVNHGTREHVHFMIVLGMRMPQLRRLPVDSADQATDHRPRRLLHFGQAEVCNFGSATRSNEDVRRLAVPMNDRRLSHVKVFEPTCNIQRYTQLK